MPKIYPIKLFPDQVLRKVCATVKKIDRETLDLIHSLIKTMEIQPGGMGIAAPQIGVLKRIAIVDVSKKDLNCKRHIIINPVILESSKMRISREGCMSIPDYTANVKRAKKIKVRWQDLQLNTHTKVAYGIEAICFQHEIDHLNGMLFLDKVSSLKSDVFQRKVYLKE